METATLAEAALTNRKNGHSHPQPPMPPKPMIDPPEGEGPQKVRFHTATLWEKEQRVDPREIFRGIGIIGWDNFTVPVLTNLLLGGTTLLVGEKGEGKTYAIRTFARALGVEYVIYNAALALWEDVIGLPEVGLLTDYEKRQELGITGYPRMKTPSTIWDKPMVGVDEANRPRLELQSKWLEFLRDQTIMGEATGAAWIWGGMNPNTKQYGGTNPLDAAYADRWKIFLPVPRVLDMDPSDAKQIIQKVTPEDYPALRVWDERMVFTTSEGRNQVYVPEGKKLQSWSPSPSFLKASRQLQSLLYAAGSIMGDVQESYDESARDYVYALCQKLSSGGGYTASGRRMEWIHMGVMGSIAVLCASERNKILLEDIGRISEVVTQLTRGMFPTIIPPTPGCVQPTSDQVENAIKQAIKELKNHKDPNYKILAEPHPIKRLKKMWELYPNPDNPTADRIVKSVLINLDPQPDGTLHPYASDTHHALLALLLLHNEEKRLLPTTTVGYLYDYYDRLASSDKNLPEITIGASGDARRLQEFIRLMNSGDTIQALATQAALQSLAGEPEIKLEDIIERVGTGAGVLEKGIRDAYDSLKP